MGIPGTIRENRVSYCSLLGYKEMKKKEKGVSDYRNSDYNIICKWHDVSLRLLAIQLV